MVKNLWASHNFSYSLCNHAAFPNIYLLLAICASGTKGLAKEGNSVAETLLRRQMFPSLATQKTYVTEILLLRNNKYFHPDTNTYKIDAEKCEKHDITRVVAKVNEIF